MDLFREYYSRLVATNKIHNLTAITDLDNVISDHFDDSLALIRAIDCASLRGLADVGTGAGFPGIPLKIIYPELPLFLIEVNGKKRAFLQELVDAFSLSDVVISELDWRTFLRSTDYPIDLFCARASLHPDELIRMFKPSSPYKEGTLVYWAASHWQPSTQVEKYCERIIAYKVGDKKRILVLLKDLSHNS